MAQYLPGEEPENIKCKLQKLFSKLDSAYPDKRIIGLAAEHKKWAEAATALYRTLGYPDKKSFLEAYGYTYLQKAGGRPATVDPKAVIRALQEKYPDGSPYTKVEELFSENPEYQPNLKTLKNVSTEVFGMPLGQYLKSIGLLQTKAPADKEKTEAGQEQNRVVRKQAQTQKESELVKKASRPVDYSAGIRLSADGKTVTGFARIRPKEKVILQIPSGVETIQDDALLKVKIDQLYIPKSLKYLGKYTLQDAKGAAKPVESVEVEDGSEHFLCDKTGFYSISGKRKTLVRLMDQTLTTYTSPGDVTDFEEGAFAGCPELKKIVVSEGAETFDEYALPDDTQVEEVFLPRTLKHFIPRGTTAYYDGKRRAFFRVDEESENLFLDEDSLYEILEDGSYKLVTCQYDGKGIPLVLEGTSVIGKMAFRGKMEMKTIDLPDSLRVIEEEAFCVSGLETLMVPEGVRQIGKRAFAWCNDLKRVQLYPNLEEVAEDAFEECAKLHNIKTVGTRKVFVYENGIVKKGKASGE